MPIPHLIHTYWEGDTNNFVEECIRRIKILHPDWNVNIYNYDTFKNISNLNIKRPEFRSDIVRIHYILTEGGVWIDASCFFNQKIHTFIDMNSDLVQGFSAPFQDNLLENWFVAAPPKHPLIQEWYDEFMYANKTGFTNYKHNAPEWLKQTPVYSRMPYLTMHGCYSVASRNSALNAKLIKSTCGPFKYLEETDWDSYKSIKNFCSIDQIKPTIPFLKIRGVERSYLDILWKYCKLNPKYSGVQITFIDKTKLFYKRHKFLFIFFLITVILSFLYVIYRMFRHT